MSIIKYICHRYPERSKILGYQLPLCTRCTGFFVGLIAYILIAFGFGFSITSKKELLIIFLFFNMPLVVDGITQYIGIRKSNNLLRLITGLLAGIGCGIAFVFILDEAF